MLVDMSTPNGQAVPQGPNSPSGECSLDAHVCTLPKAKYRFFFFLQIHTYTQIHKELYTQVKEK